MDWRSRTGLWRSRLIYNGKPFIGRRLRRFYGQFVRPGDLCFDIGAHVGNRTAAFLRLGAQTVALEPQPHCAAYLRRRFRRWENITVLPWAAGASEGQAILHINRLNPTISTLAGEDWRSAMAKASRQEENWDQAVQVQMTTLNDLIGQFGMPDFIKIDVEGHEAEVLKGLDAPVPLLSFEYLTLYPDRVRQCLDRLAQLGDYEFNWSERETLRWQSTAWTSSEIIRELFSEPFEQVISGDIYARRKRD